MDYKEILQALDESLPAVFRRKDIGKLTGGIITEALLKRIPPGVPKPSYALFGKFVTYEKKSFLKWAEEYYGQFTVCTNTGFFGTKVRRATGPAGKAGDGGQGIESS